MMEPDVRKVLLALGMAARAGKLVFGTDGVCLALRNGKAFAVAAADGNSENTNKRLRDRCAYYGKPLIHTGASPEELGRATGRHGPVAAAAVTDRSLAESFLGAAGFKKDDTNGDPGRRN